LQAYLLFIRQHWPLLSFGFISIFWGNFGQSFFISWYGASIQTSLGLSASVYGSLYSAATLGSGLAVMLLGGLIDRVPLQRFAASAGAGLMLACLLMTFSLTIPLLLLALFCLRLCGQGLLPHASHTTMARYFDNHRGKALSLAASGVPLGEILLPLIAVILIGLIGWRGSWLILAASIPLIYLPASLYLLRKASQTTHRPPALEEPSSATPPKGAGRRQVLSDYRFWLALPAVLSAPFVVTGIFIQQGFVLNEKGWDPLWLASCFVVYGITHWCSSLLAGLLVDLFSACRLLPFMLLPLIAAVLALAGLDGLWVAPLFMALLGITIGIAGPVTGALWAEVYGTAKLGSIRSLTSAMMIFSTAASPVLYGAFIDVGVSLARLFIGTALGVGLASFLALFAYRQDRPKPLEP